MDFRPLKESERKQLLQALHKNAENGGTILMNPKDTSFAGVTTEEVSHVYDVGFYYCLYLLFLAHWVLS
jgi:hypothetical protein